MIKLLTISTSSFHLYNLENRSVIQQLLILFNKVINTTHQTDIIYLNFRKAFDSVPHKELLFKLNHLGISGNVWMWFRFCLLHHQQCVKINNRYSDFLPGIPQGSILGPLLFLVYINGLPDHILSSTLLLFADDTKCFKTITDENNSHEDLNILDRWRISSNLLFNLTKNLFYIIQTLPNSILLYWQQSKFLLTETWVSLFPQT